MPEISRWCNWGAPNPKGTQKWVWLSLSPPPPSPWAAMQGKEKSCPSPAQRGLAARRPLAEVLPAARGKSDFMVWHIFRGPEIGRAPLMNWWKSELSHRREADVGAWKSRAYYRTVILHFYSHCPLLTEVEEGMGLELPSYYRGVED